MNNNQMRQTVKTDTSQIKKEKFNKIFKELIHNVNRNPQPS